MVPTLASAAICSRTSPERFSNFRRIRRDLGFAFALAVWYRRHPCDRPCDHPPFHCLGDGRFQSAHGRFDHLLGFGLASGPVS
jgi:hypothetical protein